MRAGESPNLAKPGHVTMPSPSAATWVEWKGKTGPLFTHSHEFGPKYLESKYKGRSSGAVLSAVDVVLRVDRRWNMHVAVGIPPPSLSLSHSSSSIPPTSLSPFK